MAYKIQVTCPSCAFRASLPGDAVLVTVNFNGESARYSFICMRCRESQVRTADSEEMAALELGGASIKRDTPTGPAFSEDDVIDLMLELESGSWL